MATATAAKKAATTNGNGKTTAAKAQTIAERVKAQGGIAKVTLGELRDELGFARLGKTVLQTMAEHLSENSLGHFPAWVLTDENAEPRQWHEVWLYERDGSAASVVLDAVSDPDTHDLVSALKMFSADTPDYSKMKPEARMALIKTISEA